jgi:hypothetical protein
MQLGIPADHPAIREQGREEITTITIKVTMPDLSSQTITVGILVTLCFFFRLCIDGSPIRLTVISFSGCVLMDHRSD